MKMMFNTLAKLFLAKRRVSKLFFCAANKRERAVLDIRYSFILTEDTSLSTEIHIDGRCKSRWIKLSWPTSSKGSWRLFFPDIRTSKEPIQMSRTHTRYEWSWYRTKPIGVGTTTHASVLFDSSSRERTFPTRCDTSSQTHLRSLVDMRSLRARDLISSGEVCPGAMAFLVGSVQTFAFAFHRVGVAWLDHLYKVHHGGHDDRSDDWRRLLINTSETWLIAGDGAR